MTETPKIWSVTLRPSRSLTREGFIALMVIVGAVNFIGGILFLSLGAWPVLGFLGLDAALVWWAFRQNFRDGEVAEQISIAGDEVVLRRQRRGVVTSEHQFNRRWLSVVLEHDAERELVGPLSLRSHGQSYVIGAFLGAEERTSLARALQAALANF